MKNSRRFALPLMLAILASTLVTVVAIQGQNGQTPTKAKVLRRGDKIADPLSEQEMTDAQTPTVDFTASDMPTDPGARARRKAKGERYEGRPEKVKELPDNIMPLPLNVHWWAGLPALPVAQSDAIVLGEITDAQAHLSDDKSGVYSEFTIRIDELLKNSDQSPLAAGSLAVAERPGGKVKFPSGKVQRYGIDKQGMPRVHGRYVLFLKSNGQGQDFTIVTGYELRNGAVFPLDNARSGSGGSELPFDAYKGANEINFLASVRDAIAAKGGVNSSAHKLISGKGK